MTYFPHTYIGVVGTNGAGKSEICSYLITKGFRVYSLSDIVRKEATKNGWPTDRDHLVQMGTLLKSRFGMNVLAKMVHSQAKTESMRLVVFDSIRHIDEVRYLKDRHVHILGVDAPLELRYARIQSRKKDTDSVDFETFKQQDLRELLGASGGQHIAEALQECSLIIQNTGSLSDLHLQVDGFLQGI